MNKVALIDVCDVVADLCGETLRRLDIQLPQQINDWDIFNNVSKEDGARIMELYNMQSFWKELPVIKNAQQGVNALRESGYRIHWITSPWYSCDNWENIRRDWLARHFGTGPLDMTSTAEKYRFNGDIFIDDRPKHVLQWQQHHPNAHAWLFNSRLNDYFQWPKKCRWGAEGITP